MTGKHGRKKQAWQQEQEDRDARHKTEFSGHRARLESLKFMSSKVLPVAGPHLLNLPKQRHQCGPGVQKPEPTGDIPHTIPQSPFFMTVTEVKISLETQVITKFSWGSQVKGDFAEADTGGRRFG